MDGITIRRTNHNGKSYPKDAEVSFPDAEFALLESMGFVERRDVVATPLIASDDALKFKGRAKRA